MQVQLDIEFDQLVKLAKRLPVSQWTKLKQQVDKKVKTSKTVSGLEAFLMTAPTYTKKQLNEIDKTRKAINQWRTK
jgi:hypothetical protein